LNLPCPTVLFAGALNRLICQHPSQMLSCTNNYNTSNNLHTLQASKCGESPTRSGRHVRFPARFNT
jgi:hypothetical protein